MQQHEKACTTCVCQADTTHQIHPVHRTAESMHLKQFGACQQSLFLGCTHLHRTHARVYRHTHTHTLWLGAPEICTHSQRFEGFMVLFPCSMSHTGPPAGFQHGLSAPHLTSCCLQGHGTQAQVDSPCCGRIWTERVPSRHCRTRACRVLAMTMLM